jgi:hypothetical protein
VKKPKKAPRARTQRRAADRRSEKLLHDRLRLAALEPGGSVERPIRVTSASQIDPTVRSLVCPACGQRLYAAHERASVVGGLVRRAVDLECRHCTHRRTAHFVIEESLPS